MNSHLKMFDLNAFEIISVIILKVEPISPLFSKLHLIYSS